MDKYSRHAHIFKHQYIRSQTLPLQLQMPFRPKHILHSRHFFSTTITMSQQPLSVLVSGAGIAGTSLALMLARHPAMNPKPIVTLIERSSTPRTTGQAIDIRGPGVDVIRKIGLEEKIRAKHTTEKGAIILGKGGKQVAKFDMTEDANDQSFATSEFEILRGELAEIIMEEIETTNKDVGENVKTVYGESIASMEEEANGMAVKFTNGKLEAQKFDVVISADGMSSQTRPMIFKGKEFEASECIKPLGFYIAYFSIPRLEHDTDYWNWYHSPGGLCIHKRPHRTKKTMGIYLSLVLPKRMRSPEIDEILSKGVAAQKAYMRGRFEHVGWEVERILEEMDRTDDFYMQQSGFVRVPKWTSGRFAMIGDSATCTMGIGTSLAMMGAYMVSGELSKLKSKDGGEIATALSRYEEGLRPYTDKNLQVPPGFPQFANPQTSWGISVFHAVTKTVSFTKLDKLMGKVIQGGSKETWKLPDYGW
jgi:2-polyprenyl-6-methoxyphenol hydroxylase-like FAD-dependent oxidoreductase